MKGDWDMDGRKTHAPHMESLRPVTLIGAWDVDG